MHAKCHTSGLVFMQCKPMFQPVSVVLCVLLHEAHHREKHGAILEIQSHTFFMNRSVLESNLCANKKLVCLQVIWKLLTELGTNFGFHSIFFGIIWFYKISYLKYLSECLQIVRTINEQFNYFNWTFINLTFCFSLSFPLTFNGSCLCLLFV